jgi:hypothetical protein
MQALSGSAHKAVGVADPSVSTTAGWANGIFSTSKGAAKRVFRLFEAGAMPAATRAFDGYSFRFLNGLDWLLGTHQSRFRKIAKGFSQFFEKRRAAAESQRPANRGI